MTGRTPGLQIRFQTLNTWLCIAQARKPKGERTCSEHYQDEEHLYSMDSGLDEITKKVT